MTLTVYEIRAIIVVNPHTNFGSNITNSSQVIMENVRSWRTQARTNGRTEPLIWWCWALYNMLTLSYLTCVFILMSIEPIGFLFISITNFQQNRQFDLDLWPLTLTFYEMCATINVNPHTKFGSNSTIVHKLGWKTFVRDGPTHGPTDGPNP